MHYIKALLILFAAIILNACAPQQALIKQTNSGYPEGKFSNTTVDVVRSKIIDSCSSNGLMVFDTNNNQIVCGKTMSGNEAILAQMIVGNSYSTTPEKRVRFIIYQLNNDVKVTANQWIESQMAMGQVRKQELNSNNQNNTIQQMLFSLGAE